MTESAAARVPDQAPGLAALLDLPVAEFAATTWGREARLMTRAARAVAHPATLPNGPSDPIAGLLDLGAVDELISVRGLRAPFLRVAKQGRTRPDRDFTRSGGVGAGVADQLDDTALLRLFAEGSTLVLQGLHRTHPPVIEFVQRLAADLGHPVQANSYITPADNTGFSAHYDVHDVFVLQVSGTKRWRIHPPVHPAPLRGQPWDQYREAVADAAEREPAIDATLSPGDVLYLPRGWLHSATAAGEVSVHLTFGVHTWHRGHLADLAIEQLRSALAQQPELRTSLPVGVDLSGREGIQADLDAVREALVAAVAGLDARAVATSLGERQLLAQPPGPVGPLANVAAAHRPSDAVVLRANLGARVERSEGAVTLQTRLGAVPAPPEAAAALADLVDAGHIEVASLGADLARRLLLEGVVVPRELSQP